MTWRIILEGDTVNEMIMVHTILSALIEKIENHDSLSETKKREDVE